MRTTTKLSLATLALTAALSACSQGRATDTAAQDDFKRDLQLASSTSLDLAGPKVDPSLLNSLETNPQGAPEAATTVKKGAGNRAVRSQTPTVLATPETDVAAVDETDVVEALSEAPAPELNSEPVAVAPRPAPVIVQTGGAGDYGTGSNGGGVFGGGIGVVIRGGGVDGDHCEIHRGRGRTTSRGPVYVPNIPIIPSRGRGISISSRIPGASGGGRSMPQSGGSRPTYSRSRSR